LREEGKASSEVHKLTMTREGEGQLRRSRRGGGRERVGVRYTRGLGWHRKGVQRRTTPDGTGGGKERWQIQKNTTHTQVT